MASGQQKFMPPCPPELICDAPAAPWGSPGAWMATSDDAPIWYTKTGSGTPLVLLHGWWVNSRFWMRNVQELAKHFEVIVPELRGHGSSGKVVHGHTIARYAKDIHELVSYLGLERPVLAGWSLAGSILLEYWRHYGEAGTRGLALLDSNIAPFSNADWNAFIMKKGKSDQQNANMRIMRKDPEWFCPKFIAAMFGDGKGTEEEIAWMNDEVAKTPPWIAQAILSDWTIRNYAPVLPTVTVPTAVFSGQAPKGNMEMGKHYAEMLPKGQYFPYPHCGHLFFYEDAAAFNAQLTEFAGGLA